MSELDDKLNSILSNPAMMQQIMSLAQALNQSEAQQPPPQQPPAQQPQVTQPQIPQDHFAPTNDRGLNPNLLSKIATLMQRGSIDKNQEALLRALRPYLNNQKLEKLERAMHAAKMAGIASEMVNTRGQSPFPRR
ncbi:MAG: hypothetical protein MR426_05305 [Clostridiales bacterium]|nr:hypothetical protein [Clostridiales bacterium]